MAERPNILFIYSDQHRWDCLGAHGHPLVQTPNLDRLAAEGCDFRQAYTPCPICVPARVSLLNGQYTACHGTINNYDAESFRRPDPEQPTHPRVVGGAGYHTWHIGRWHVDPRRPAQDFGFHEFLQDWRYGKYRSRLDLAPKQPAERYGGIDPNPFEHSSLAWHARQVNAAIDWSQTQDSDPFLIHWHMLEPHPAYWPVQAFAERYDPAAIDPWPGFADDLADKPWIQRQMPANWGIADLGWEDWAPVVARYLAVISQLDAAVGLVLDELDRRGLAENTLVVYTSDHGDLCGSHHMFDKHYVMYDDVTRIPLLMRWPGGGIPAGRICEDFVTNG
ncbi:MAG: sulfatase-like hydrolase/transferase, partial [Planctomycetota bacterium]